MPEDSIERIMWAFARHPISFNEYGRNLFNSDLDMQRSFDNIQFGYYVDDAFNYLDNVEKFYKNEGPLKLSELADAFWDEQIKKQGVTETSYRWNVLQIINDPFILYSIDTYLINFVQPIDALIASLEKFKETVYLNTGVTSEELQEFLEAKSMNRFYNRQ